MNGRDYMVFPVVLVVAGVLNGMDLPESEIERSVPGWNGRPVTVRHPTSYGNYVSANSPDILAKFAVGFIFNVAMRDGGKLVGEAWIDGKRLSELGFSDLLERLVNGDLCEVSTGYFCDVTPEEGVKDGKEYFGVQSKLVPDHLALLPDQIGACSVEDGCGIPRVNNNGGSMSEEMIEQIEGDAAPGAVSEVEEVASDEAVEVVANEVADVTLPDGLSDLLAVVNEFGGAAGLRALLNGINKANEVRRASAINRVLNMSGGALAADDLAGLSEESLARMEQALTAANHAGRVQTNGRSSEPAETWIVLSPKGE